MAARKPGRQQRRARKKRRHRAPIRRELREQLDLALREATDAEKSLELEVPAGILEIAKACAASVGRDIPQKSVQRLLYEAYVWFLWKHVGMRQMRQQDTGGSGWVPVHSKFRKEAFTTKYKERIDALLEMRAPSGRPVLEQRGAFEIGKAAQPFKLAGELVPHSIDDDEANIRKVRLKEMLARGKIKGYLSERAKRIKKRLDDEGAGRALAIVSAHRVMRRRRLSGQVRAATLADLPSVKHVVSGQGRFWVTTDNYTGRVYTPVSAMKKEAKELLTDTDGTWLVAWDWPAHQWWILAMLLPRAARTEFVEEMSKESLYDQCLAAKKPAKGGYKKALGRDYADWLLGPERRRKPPKRPGKRRRLGKHRTDSYESARDYIKERASAVLHKNPDEGQVRNQFLSWLKERWPEVAEGIEGLRLRFPSDKLSKRLFSEERKIRSWVLTELARNGVTLVLDDHDGGRVTLGDGGLLVDVLDRASRQFFEERCEARYKLGPAAVDPYRLLELSEKHRQQQQARSKARRRKSDIFSRSKRSS